jgi:hypothetical protein
LRGRASAIVRIEALRFAAITGVTLLLAVGAGAAARASSGSSAPTARARAASPFTTLRVCGTNKTPFKGKQCARDMRKTALLFKEVDCSVLVTVNKSTTFSASISYNGHLQYLVHTLLKKGRHKELVGARLRAVQMPGGSYTCEFRLGTKRARATFTSKGPTGHFIGANVCVTPAKNRTCAADAAGHPISAPRSLMCGGVFVGFAGKSWGVRIVRQTSSSPVTVAQYAARHLRAPISEQWVGFKSRTKAGIYRPAKYSCLYYAAGKLVGSHDFSVSK